MTVADDRRARALALARVGRKVLHAALSVCLALSLAWLGLEVWQAPSRVDAAHSREETAETETAKVSSELDQVTAAGKPDVSSAAKAASDVAKAENGLLGDQATSASTLEGVGLDATAWPGKGTWKAVTGVSFEGSSCEVMWECRSGDDSLTAVATATYDAGTGRFSDLRTWVVA